MFGENQITPQGISGNSLTASLQPAPQQEYGVSSAVKDLLEVSSNLAKNCYQLKGTLGILPPKGDGQATPVESSLVGTIRCIVQVLNTANGDVMDCIRHLNN